MTDERPNFGLGRLIVNCVASAVIFPPLILGLAGNWRWVEGWLFALWWVVMIETITLYLFVKDPSLLAERAQRPGSKNQKRWDKYVLVGIYAMAGVWLCIMPLDAERFGWSQEFPTWVKVAGCALLVPALVLMVRATVDNAYLSSLVRIQSDRQHRVVTTGSYAYVRHPLYLGCLLMMIGAPLLLGSVWGLIVTALGSVLVVGRILGEERMLREELAGYEEYAHRVRYRLVPFVW